MSLAQLPAPTKEAAPLGLGPCLTANQAKTAEANPAHRNMLPYPLSAFWAKLPCQRLVMVLTAGAELLPGDMQ